jgi:riboflavin kinase/FMN adenylyltransferase
VWHALSVAKGVIRPSTTPFAAQGVPPNRHQIRKLTTDNQPPTASPVKLLHSLDDFPKTLRGGAVAIGNFDGVHLGHARLLGRLRAMAQQVGGPAVVLTFDPAPVRILRPQAAPEPLLGVERKIELLAELGVDATVVYPTSKAFLELQARQFFDHVVCDRLGARAMVEGPNFFFGHNRSGNVEVLRAFCAEAHMPFEVTEPVEIDGQIVSSSRIRSLVAAGRLAEARKMLGRPYRIRGLVARGAGRGAQIGYPTANLSQIDTLLPAEGVYAARARTEQLWYPAAVAVGPNPTFGEDGLKVEAYLVGFQGMIYDRPIEVDFLAQLREIKRFASVDALLAQMAGDVAQTVEMAGESCTAEDVV